MMTTFSHLISHSRDFVLENYNPCSVLSLPAISLNTWPNNYEGRAKTYKSFSSFIPYFNFVINKVSFLLNYTYFFLYNIYYYRNEWVARVSFSLMRMSILSYQMSFASNWVCLIFLSSSLLLMRLCILWFFLLKMLFVIWFKFAISWMLFRSVKNNWLLILFWVS